jgi:hypothetical protein
MPEAVYVLQSSESSGSCTAHDHHHLHRGLLGLQGLALKPLAPLVPSTYTLVIHIHTHWMPSTPDDSHTHTGDHYYQEIQLTARRLDCV